MNLNINLRQAQILEAADRGEILRDETNMRWWTTAGHAVTASADVLIRKNLMSPSTTVTDNRYRQAVLTTRGRLMLDELASREPDHTEHKPEYTDTQLIVLRAAGASHVSQAEGAATWRMFTEPDSREHHRRGRPVTQIAERLIARGVARKSTELVNGRRPLVVTAAGYELLSEVSHRS